MKKSLIRAKLFGLSLILASGMAFSASVPAGPLLEQLPSSHLDGLQSDTGTSPWTEGFSTPGPASLSQVSWWGYYLEGTDNEEGGNYLFSVDIGGSGPLSGTVTRSFDSVITDANDPQFSLNLYRYEIALPNISFAGGSSTLEISNNSQDVVWLWQGSPGAGRAFGIAQAVPEPSPVVLMLLGIATLGLVFTARRPRRYA